MAVSFELLSECHVILPLKESLYDDASNGEKETKNSKEYST